MYIPLNTPIEEIDYNFLKSALSQYPKFRDKITRLIKNKEILRIKKGLYVLGEQHSQVPFYKETLANLIYGPSCISLEYALSYYGLIPEKVLNITSVTPNRNKKFVTPVGLFTYRYLSPTAYQHGITQLDLDWQHSVIIATVEKAIADTLKLVAPTITNTTELESYLVEDLRIDLVEIKKLNIRALRYLERHYDSKTLTTFLKLL